VAARSPSPSSRPSRRTPGARIARPADLTAAQLALIAALIAQAKAAGQ